MSEKCPYCSSKKEHDAKQTFLEAAEIVGREYDRISDKHRMPSEYIKGKLDALADIEGDLRAKGF